MYAFYFLKKGCFTESQNYQDFMKNKLTLVISDRIIQECFQDEHRTYNEQSKLGIKILHCEI